MCINYSGGRCNANNNKKCLLGEEGYKAEQGECELHGEYSVWKLEDRVMVSKKEGEYPEIAEALVRWVNFLTADELAYRNSKRLRVPVDYDLD